MTFDGAVKFLVHGGVAPGSLFNNMHFATAMHIYDTATGRMLAKLQSTELIDLTDELLVHRPSLPIPGHSVEVWDLRACKSLFITKQAQFCEWNAQTRLLLAGRWPGTDPSEYQWQAWNLNTLRLEGEFTWRGTPMLSPCGRRVAVDGSIREAPSGRLIAKYGVAAHHRRFSHDGRFLAVVSMNPWSLWMIDAQSGNILWEARAGEDDHIMADLFGQGSRILFAYHGRPRHLVAYDTQTGVKRITVPLPAWMPDDGRDEPILDLTPDQRFLMICDYQRTPVAGDPTIWARIKAWIPGLNRLPDAKNDIMLVLECDTCRERFRLQGSDVKYAQLSEDGRTLVTSHGEWGQNVLRCWDVDGWKPLRWAIGSPAALGAVLLLTWKWRQRRANATKT